MKISSMQRNLEMQQCIITAIFTARHSYASVVLGVEILSVRPYVTRVLCDKTKQRTADILIPYERAITLAFWHQQWLVGVPPSVWNLRSNWPTPSKNANFDYFRL